MLKRNASIAKITRPKLTGIFPRPRLFSLLDGESAKPITWISAPAGSGKTTLVGSWLDARKLPCLWYQIDEGDGDIANFFYYMGLAAKKAAPRYRTPLPLLTPEYLMGLSTFTKRYFENLFSRMKPPFALVFDNYQDAPLDTGLHEVMRAGLSAISDGIRVIVISRSESPPALARLRAFETMGVIEWNEIRFTLEETKTLIRNREQKRLPDAAVKKLHDTTGGWAAGLVLMMSRTEIGPEGPHTISELAPEQVFDYFAGEVFDKLDSETRDFLLMASFLPRMTPETTAKLTDNEQAGRILSGLRRNHFFTEQHAAAEAVYQFHPLFRSFLLTRVKESLSRDGILRVQNRAAGLLVETGQIEDAVALYLETADWESVIRLILGHAQAVVMQGRSKMLEGWLNGIPRELRETTPWILYWLAICRMPFNPAESRAYSDGAFQLFDAQKDSTGALLSCSAAIDATIYEWNDFMPLDQWIAALERHLSLDAPHPSPEVAARATVSMAAALMVRRPRHRDIDLWIERSLSLSGQSPDINLRIQAYVFAGNYCFWVGDQGRGRLVLEKIHELAGLPQAFPLLKLTWMWMEGCLDIWSASPPAAALIDRVAKAVEYADATGVHIWDHMLYAMGAYGFLLQNDAARGGAFLGNISALAVSSRRHIDCLYHYLSSWQQLIIGQSARATAHADTAVNLAEETGYVFPIILCRFEKAQVLHEQRRYGDAEKQITFAHTLSLQTKSRIFEFMCLLEKTRLALDQSGKSAEGLKLLQEALRLGREKEYFNLLWWWDAAAMTQLCAKALEAGIEVDYARKLIGIHGLVPDQPLLHIENWPWPVKIYTFGSFKIEVEGKTLSISRSQQKPLLMLKSLIAFGGEDVPEDRLTDALWPEAEGDVGRRSFDTTLHRLRKLLGSDKAVTILKGKLTLDPRHFWTDIRAFERFISDAGSLWSASSERKDVKKTIEAIRLYEKAAALYKGHFLPSDMRESWAAPARERVRAKFITAVIRLSGHYQAERKYDKAIEFLQEGLAIEGLSEELYQGLMTCYQQTGRESEAAAVYHQCRKVLSDTLGVGPSTKTEEIYSSLRFTDRSS